MEKHEAAELRVGNRVLVQHPKTDWHPCQIVSITHFFDEDFPRFNVILKDGRCVRGCHPTVIREVSLG